MTMKTTAPLSIRPYFLTFVLSVLSILMFVNTAAAENNNEKDIILFDTLGQKHKVSEYIGTGKWLVLNIWGTRCPPCKEEVPELVMFHDEHKNDLATVLAIAIDFPSYGYAKKDEVAAFMDDYLIEFPVLLSDSYITQALGLGTLKGLPTTFLYTPDGKLVAKQVGGVTQDILENFIRQYDIKHPPLTNKN